METKLANVRLIEFTSGGWGRLIVPETTGEPREWLFNTDGSFPLAVYGRVMRNKDFPIQYRLKEKNPSCEVRFFRIDSEYDKLVTLKGSDFLFPDEKKYFRSMTQMLCFMQKMREFLSDEIHCGRLPVIPFMDIDNGLSVAYVVCKKIRITGEDHYLYFKTYEEFKNEEFKIYISSPNCSRRESSEHQFDDKYFLYLLGEEIKKDKS